MKIKSGNIPEKLTFFLRNPTKVYFSWDDIEYDDNFKHDEIEVYPCFISDSTNKKTLESGKSWAGQSYWDYEQKKSIKSTSQSFEIDNKPIKKIKIITLEIRDQGGRAYKVICEINGKNCYFDLREDVLLDCMIHEGIKPGAELTGEFIFARVGAQMKIIRVGSLLHEKMIEATKLDTKEKLTLEIGGVYSTKNGDEYVFLGEYYTRDIKLEDYEKGFYNHALGGYSYYFKSAKLKNSEKMFVFHKYRDFYDKDGSLWFHSKETQYSKVGDVNAFGLHIIKSHNFKIKSREVNVPENYYLDVQKRMLQDNKKEYLVAEHSKLFNLSKEKGYIHPLFKNYE